MLLYPYGGSTIDKKYTAGFFDGEGSAMVLTIRRKLKTGVIYRFRPVIKIAQKTNEVLEDIKDFIGYGHIDYGIERNSYTINGLEGVLAFINKIAPHCCIKRDALLVVGELAKFQSAHHRRNIPFTFEDTVKMLDIRDRLFEINKITRTGLKQKYPREQILTESTFVKDIHQWQINRAKKGATALMEAGKPFRFKKGENRAS